MERRGEREKGRRRVGKEGEEKRRKINSYLYCVFVFVQWGSQWRLFIHLFSKSIKLCSSNNFNDNYSNDKMYLSIPNFLTGVINCILDFEKFQRRLQEKRILILGCVWLFKIIIVAPSSFLLLLKLQLWIHKDRQNVTSDLKNDPLCATAHQQTFYNVLKTPGQ